MNFGICQGSFCFYPVCFSPFGGFAMKLRSSLPDISWYFGLPPAIASLFFIVCTIIGASSLQLETTTDKTMVGLLMILPILLALFLLQRENCPATSLFLLLLPIALSLYLRIFLLDHQTHDYQTFLAQWAAFFRNNGGFAALKEPVGNYNVPYLYFLAAISYLPIPDLYLIKIGSIMCDVLLAWGGFRLTRQFTRDYSPAPLICFSILSLLPTVILNGACWAQCDSLYTALILLSLSAIWEKRPKTSVLLLALAFSFKLQTVFLIPLWCAFLVYRSGQVPSSASIPGRICGYYSARSGFGETTAGHSRYLYRANRRTRELPHFKCTLYFCVSPLSSTSEHLFVVHAGYRRRLYPRFRCVGHTLFSASPHLQRNLSRHCNSACVGHSLSPSPYARTLFLSCRNDRRCVGLRQPSSFSRCASSRVFLSQLLQHVPALAVHSSSAD